MRTSRFTYVQTVCRIYMFQTTQVAINYACQSKNTCAQIANTDRSIRGHGSACLRFRLLRLSYSIISLWFCKWKWCVPGWRKAGMLCIIPMFFKRFLFISLCCHTGPNWVATLNAGKGGAHASYYHRANKQVWTLTAWLLFTHYLCAAC